MTYMALIYGPPFPPHFALPPEADAAWTTYMTAAAESGVLRGGHQLEHTSLATTIAVVDGKRVVTAGPFAETAEVLGGYLMLECANLDEALDWAARCPATMMGGRLEVRPVVERPA